MIIEFTVILFEIFQYGCAIAVTRRTRRLYRLAAVHAYHVAHKPADEVRLQRYVALRHDVCLLRHLLAVHAYDVAPLVSVVVALVALPVLAEAVHRIVVVLSLDQNPFL